VIAVVFVRGERWDPGRVLQEQEGLDGHAAYRLYPWWGATLSPEAAP
jgi:hypothetical protein